MSEGNPFVPGHEKDFEGLPPDVREEIERSVIERMMMPDDVTLSLMRGEGSLLKRRGTRKLPRLGDHR